MRLLTNIISFILACVALFLFAVCTLIVMIQDAIIKTIEKLRT